MLLIFVAKVVLGVMQYISKGRKVKLKFVYAKFFKIKMFSSKRSKNLVNAEVDKNF